VNTPAVVCPSDTAKAAPAKADRTEKTDATKGWSATVEGVRGRLIVTSAPAIDGKPQVRIELEIENVSDSAMPIAIGWGNLSQVLELSLEDESGAPVARDAVPGNEITMQPSWLALPVSSSLRVVASKAAYEHVPNGRTMLRPFTFQAWTIPAARGPLYLRGKLTPLQVNDAGNRRPWSGPLSLPRVPLPA
jgi:hypothetical protein